MMTHDPFQNYQTQGAYSGGATPFGLPYTAFQPSFNPAVAGQPQVNPGIGGYGIYPHPFQGVGIAGQLGLVQQLLALNPLGAAGLQNPLLAAGVQHPLAQVPWQNPLLAYQGWPQQQAQFGYPQQQAQFGYPQQQPQFGYPQQQAQLGYPQQQPQFQSWPQQQPQTGYPLAPQSLVGAGGMGQPFGQIHPQVAQLLAQVGLRPATSYGMSPLAGCF